MAAQEPSERVVSMKLKLEAAQEYAANQPWENWSIYRVPRRIRETQETKFYVPRTVSIGPYHHTDDQVKSMDRHKWISLYQILEGTGHDLNVYFNAIKEVEKQARSCFQQDLSHLTSNEFVEMLILDGCFILDIINGSTLQGLYNQAMIEDILLDMVMLENQIPLFILDRLLQLICDNQHKYQAVDLALHTFGPHWLTGTPVSSTELSDMKLSLGNQECLHILDIFRQSLLYQGSQQNPISQHKSWWGTICDKCLPGCLWKWYQSKMVLKRKQKRLIEVIPRATELQKSGIKLRKRSTNLFWDIKFNKGVLEIPSIWIQDSTRSILLNLIAFEECHMDMSKAVIGSYVIFMECLTKSPEDVNCLNRHGIIGQFRDDTEVGDVFKSVVKELLTDGTHYAKVVEQVNEYCSRRRNRWRASLIRTYFSNPWAIISLVAAVILLLLTVTQTIYTVWAFYRPTS